MSDVLDLAESVLAGSASAGTDLDGALWTALEETGLARLTLPEAAGGSEASFADAAEVLQAAGAHAARVPLVETDLLAGWLLHSHGLEVPDGPLTAVAADLAVDGTAVRGALERVPWARGVSAVVVLTPSHVVLLPVDGLAVTDGANLAEEPRDRVVVDGADAVVAPVAEGAAAEFRLRAALGRAQLLAGAARGALARTVQYAGERVQFGRPIGKFQAVQQQLALAASEVAASGAAASAAAAAADRDGFGAASAAFAVAAAKARTGEAAGEVARIAHQVHGAIGFTREHDLRLLTTRLWAWRDEDGSDARWQAELGATVLAAGPDALWPLVTGTP
ncbi:acyl-CoA dehydrogenase family protein [Pseudonocardia petroleophila]|uniref:Acyl-CoA dehydrogenase n=1 Tax=Pseudonocardia petroleophila TaxID=37331 RepID=A0A7G7ME80_9PSEU|nr:acyl-CoA dehydrogenase family protein [Pseudonocardia petroleophila]QNG51091.1 acyl-CoA dehydrogenase [Pseudonocardia petroleophila]